MTAAADAGLAFVGTSWVASANVELGSILRRLSTYGWAGSLSENGRNVAPAIRSIALPLHEILCR